VSDIAVTDAGDKDSRHQAREGRNVFGRIALFVRQVVSELRRVVTPTREETGRLVAVVLGFVGVMMLITFGFDTVSSLFSHWVFAG